MPKWTTSQEHAGTAQTAGSSLQTARYAGEYEYVHLILTYIARCVGTLNERHRLCMCSLDARGTPSVGAGRVLALTVEAVETVLQLPEDSTVEMVQTNSAGQSKVRCHSSQIAVDAKVEQD